MAIGRQDVKQEIVHQVMDKLKAQNFRFIARIQSMTPPHTEAWHEANEGSYRQQS
jgi:hypothetical protein